MEKSDGFKQALRSLFWVFAFTAVIVIGVIWFRNDLFQFFMTRPSINTVILALGLLGLAISISELFRLLFQARQIDGLTALDEQGTDLKQALGSVDHGIVRSRVERVIGLAGRGTINIEALTLISEADATSEESKGAFVRYVLGVMIFLGLIGTFWGVLVTVQGVQKVLEALDPSRIDDPIAFVAQLRTSMSGLLAGLSTAFSTSLFGLSGSVALGFVELQARKARYQLLGDLDRFVVSTILPRLEESAHAAPRIQPAGLDHGNQLYHFASQQTLGENLRRLTEVIAGQGATDEKMAAAIVEIKGMIEALSEERDKTRDSIQAANATRQGMLERMDNIGRHMERLVREMRLNRESADDVGKAMMDRIKLEGEITNKTLSLGFSDLMRKLDSAEPSKSVREKRNT
jgi:hypothetical protein